MNARPEHSALSLDQLRELARRRELEARHTLRMASRLQSEADACRKEIRRRQRAAKSTEVVK